MPQNKRRFWIVRALAAWAVALVIVLIFGSRAEAVVFAPNAECPGFGSFLVGAQWVGVNNSFERQSDCILYSKDITVFNRKIEPNGIATLERIPVEVDIFIFAKVWQEIIFPAKMELFDTLAFGNDSLAQFGHRSGIDPSVYAEMAGHASYVLNHEDSDYFDFSGGRIANVLNFEDSPNALFGKLVFGGSAIQVRSGLRLTNFPCDFDRFPSRAGRTLGKNGSANSRDKCEYAYSSTYNPQPESGPGPTGGLIGRIRSLPLGAKIGITVVATGLAWICELIWFLRLLNQPKRWWRDGYLFLCGLALFLSPAFLGW